MSVDKLDVTFFVRDIYVVNRLLYALAEEHCGRSYEDAARWGYGAHMEFCSTREVYAYPVQEVWEEGEEGEPGRYTWSTGKKQQPRREYERGCWVSWRARGRRDLLHKIKIEGNPNSNRRSMAEFFSIFRNEIIWESAKIKRLDIAIDYNCNINNLFIAAKAARRGESMWLEDIEDGEEQSIDSRRFWSGGRLETLYLGSRRCPLFFRIYDKRAQMRANKNIDIGEDVTRFEAELKYSENYAGMRSIVNPFERLVVFKRSPELNKPKYNVYLDYAARYGLDELLKMISPYMREKMRELLGGEHMLNRLRFDLLFAAYYQDILESTLLECGLEDIIGVKKGYYIPEKEGGEAPCISRLIAAKTGKEFTANMKTERREPCTRI